MVGKHIRRKKNKTTKKEHVLSYNIHDAKYFNLDGDRLQRKNVNNASIQIKNNKKKNKHVLEIKLKISYVIEITKQCVGKYNFSYQDTEIKSGALPLEAISQIHGILEQTI